MDYVGIDKLESRFSTDLKTLRRCVLEGRPLPPGFYRQGKGQDEDRALKEYGVMHLHLGGQKSDVLVFLMQFPDDVVALEINNHGPFSDHPPGRGVDARWRVAALVTLNEARAAAEQQRQRAEEEVKALNASIRARLGIGKKPDS